MSWGEFKTLLAGLLPETPLGEVVGIRSTQSRETIKNFNSYQKRIYNEWKTRRMEVQKENPEMMDLKMKALEKTFEIMYSKKGG